VDSGGRSETITVPTRAAPVDDAAVDSVVVFDGEDEASLTI
jgi:hypothetical protein